MAFELLAHLASLHAFPPVQPSPRAGGLTAAAYLAYLSAWDAVLLAVLLCLAWGLWAGPPAWARSRGLWLWGAAAIVLLQLSFAFVYFSHMHEGDRYWELGDDFMISMRYAWNLARGEGLVWNAGERVEGYSNFLWTLWMACIHRLPLGLATTSLAVQLSNALLLAAHLPLLRRLCARLGAADWAWKAAALALGLEHSVLHWSASGSEAILLSWVLLAAWASAMEDADLGRGRLRTYLWMGMLPLIRAEYLPHAMLLAALALGLLGRARGQAVWRLAWAALLPAALHLAFRLAYYGDLLPNTAYLKVIGWSDRLPGGLAYVAAYLKDYAGLWGAGLLGAAVLRKPRLLALAFFLLAQGAAVAYLGGDSHTFPFYRFFVPVFALAACLAFAGLEQLGASRALKGFLALLLLCALGTLRPRDQLPYENLEDGGSQLHWGLWLRANSLPESSVAATGVGSLIYFSERKGVDLLGKCDRHIARLPYTISAEPGHNKADLDHSLGVLKPDIVFPWEIGCDRWPGRETAAEHARHDFSSNGPFLSHYAGNPVLLEGQAAWPVVSDQSPELARRKGWRRR